MIKNIAKVIAFAALIGGSTVQAATCNPDELNAKHMSTMQIERAGHVFDMPTVRMNTRPSGCSSDSLIYVGDPATVGVWTNSEGYQFASRNFEELMRLARERGWTFITKKD